MVVYEFPIPTYEYSAIWRALYGFLAIAHNLLRVLFWDRVPELLQMSELIVG